MSRIVLAVVLLTAFAILRPAFAQAPFETNEGRLCLEGWITEATQRLNAYDGTDEFNSRKRWRINRFGFFMGEGMSSNYEPDDWAAFGANRDTYMWNLYDSELEYPVWPNPNFTSARVPGLRYYVNACLAGLPAGTAGGTVTTVPATPTPAVPVVPGVTPGLAIPATALCPATMSPLSSYPGTLLGCTCSADMITGQVWGSGPYTYDSNLCSAAVHGGAIPATGGPIWATVTDGLPAYAGSMRNGITTLDYGAYGPSMTILNAAPGAAVVSQIEACPSSMVGRTETLTCSCAPARFSTSGVWGSGVYTWDSNLCTAALHAGVVTNAGGEVTVRPLADAGGYTGSTSNGVTSQSYGAWQGAMEFVR